jgi:sortase (surface protein transpeptidase)
VATRRRRPSGPRGRVAVVLGLLALTSAGCGSGGHAASAPSATHATTASAPTAPEPAATARAVSRPVRVSIPAIGVNSSLIDLGLQADGSLQVPATGFPAGWFTGGPAPGELGPAVLAGHVDWGGSPGVFYRLRDVVAGDAITVARQDGSTVTFRVSRVARYAKNAFPTRAVYGNLDHPALRVITCGGAFDRHARSYVDNIVVFADLVAAPHN